VAVTTTDCGESFGSPAVSACDAESGMRTATTLNSTAPPAACMVRNMRIIPCRYPNDFPDDSMTASDADDAAFTAMGRRRRPAHARPTLSPQGIPLAQRTPAGRMGDHDKEVSWLAAWSPCITFPDCVNPVVFDARRTAYSCGGSPGLFTRVPLNPLSGDLVVWAVRCRKSF
jgi:hypothetical protein